MKLILHFVKYFMHINNSTVDKDLNPAVGLFKNAFIVYFFFIYLINLKMEFPMEIILDVDFEVNYVLHIYVIK